MLLLICGGALRAQSAATVPASSGIYDRLESVTAYYPTDQLPLGVRPLSRAELVRIVDDLASRVEADGRGHAGRRAWALRELALVSRALGGRPTDERLTVRGAVGSEFFAASAAPDTIESNGLGSIDAVSHPFGDLRQGRAAERGAALIVTPTTSAGLTGRLALAVEPRLTIHSPPAASASFELLMHRAYARGVYRNVAVRVGMDEMLWGQSATGALFISGNAMPLPAVSIGTEAPVVLPWLFRFAGPVTMTAMLADLGRAQDPPHAKLAGWHVAMQPWPRFELGVSVLAQQGGRGGPDATLPERIIDLLPIIDALAPQRADFQFSNKLAGGNLRLRFPELSGLDLYYELMIDDFDLRRFESTVIDEFSHLLGARVPVLMGEGQVVLRAELHNTSLRVYEHTQYRSGVTFRDRLIGNPLGPNAKGGRGSVAWRPSPALELAVEVADDARDPSLYTSTAAGSFDEGFRLIRVTDEPKIHRRRFVARVARVVSVGSFRVEGGYNRDWRSGQRGRGEWGAVLAFRSGGLRSF